MRIKIVLALLLVGVVGLVGILSLTHLAAPVQPTATSATPEPAAPIVQDTTQPTDSKTIKTDVASESVDTNAIAEEHEAKIRTQIEKLQDLQTDDSTNAQSFRAIMDELTNPEKEIREAAIEAAIQFGNRDAIPVLNDLASRFGDDEGKKAMRDAAEFLALPTLTEVIAAHPNAGIMQPPVPMPSPERGAHERTEPAAPAEPNPNR